MMLIPLSQGKQTMVDDEDYHSLIQFKWHAETCSSGVWYAKRSSYENGRLQIICMHRQILGLGFGDGIIVDHSDRDGLNNQKWNLRKCSKANNQRNCKRNSLNTSGFKGVCKCSRTGKWRAYINLNDKQIYLGRFDKIDDAAAAYKNAAPKFHGEFARVA